MVKKFAIVAFLFAGVFTIASFTSFLPDHCDHIKASPREQKIQKEVFKQITSFRDYVRDSLLPEVSKTNADTPSTSVSLVMYLGGVTPLNSGRK